MGQVCCQPISHARPHAGSPNGRSTMPAKLQGTSRTVRRRKQEQQQPSPRSDARSAAWDSLRSHYWAPPVPSNHERMLIPYIYTPVPCMRAGTSPTLVGGVLLRLPPGLRPTKGPQMNSWRDASRGINALPTQRVSHEPQRFGGDRYTSVRE
jgi:hypothetical protein